MPDTYKLTMLIEKNGVPVPSFNPLVRRLTVDQSQAFDDILVSGGGDVALPISLIGTLSFLLLHVNQTETLKLGDITMSAGGVVLLFNAQNTTETLNNASGSDALNRGLAGGT
mgnify:CR=1 FL=1